MSTNKLIFWAMVLITVLTVSLGVHVQNTGASPLQGFSAPYIYNLQYNVGGGDCSADRATGDLYTPHDPYCVGHPPAKISLDYSFTLPPVATTPAPVIIQQANPTRKPRNDDQNSPTKVSTPAPTQDSGNDPTDEPEVNPTDDPPPAPTQKPPKTPKPKPTKDHCDKGGGNGGEGCDPGNNPGNGNDDEPGDCDKDRDKKDHNSPWKWPKKKH